MQGATNLLQFTALGLRVILAVGIFIIASMFISKIWKARKSDIELSPFLGFAIFFFSLSASSILFAFHDYMTIEAAYLSLSASSLTILYKISISAGYLGMIGLVFVSEKVWGKTKFGLTIINLISLILGLFLLDRGGLQLLTYFTILPNLIFIMLIFLNFFVLKTRGEIRRKMRNAFYCLLGFGLFYLLDTELIASILLIERELLKIISYSGILITLVLWGLIFLSFETFTEFGWKDKLRELFIIGPNREALFHYSFIDKTIPETLDLISTSLTGVKDILMEMMKTDVPLKVVDHQDLKVIFEYGKYITIILMANENLRIFHSKLASLSKLFEELYQDYFADWRGETDVFLSSKFLVENIFS
ncbi:MAG: hypothetical protein HWN65_10380 [Candidatus Helarchaeota archaeon]|nr:hypothetical protein [Candidatus Helarchaeota archaeon]